MKVSLADSGVPFVVSYRKILRKPKLERTRRFVGPMQFAKNVMLKAIEFFEDAAFETDTKVIEPGRSTAVHWAISVEDPWDTTPGREANLVAFRMLDDMPPCGAHFEIISPPKDDARNQMDHEVAPEDLPSEISPEQARRENVFRRPPDPAYAPRPVAPLDAADDRTTPTNGTSGSLEAEGHEIAARVDRTGGLGEDD